MSMFVIKRLKDLESLLSDVSHFDNPKIQLEQVSTSPHLASRMLFTAANNFDDIKNCTVGDFGCGAGILSIGCHFLGSAAVTGFEVDEDAIDSAWVNCKKLEIDSIDFVLTDMQCLHLSRGFDTVVMNPPFGTRIAGIDTLFVKQGMANASTVYSLHKTSTREHFQRLAENENWQIEVLAELKYDLPQVHKFHKQKSKDIFVDLYRFTHKS